MQLGCKAGETKRAHSTFCRLASSSRKPQCPSSNLATLRAPTQRAVCVCALGTALENGRLVNG